MCRWVGINIFSSSHSLICKHCIKYVQSWIPYNIVHPMTLFIIVRFVEKTINTSSVLKMRNFISSAISSNMKVQIKRSEQEIHSRVNRSVVIEGRSKASNPAFKMNCLENFIYSQSQPKFLKESQEKY